MTRSLDSPPLLGCATRSRKGSLSGLLSIAWLGIPLHPDGWRGWAPRAWGRLAAAVLLLAGLAGAVEAEDAAVPAPSEPVIRVDMDVGLEYVLTVDGVVVDSTKGQGPWHYIHGHQQMIRGLERQLEGLHVGDERDITVSPAEGYGEVDPELFVEIPLSDLPSDTPPTVGMVLRGVNPDGKSFQARITDIKPDTVILDLNDPLAGRTLHFAVKVTDITPIPSQ